MKLLTLNTHSWLEDNQDEKLHQLAMKIHDEQFDVIALQEINQTAESSVLTSPFHFCEPTMTKTTIKEDNFALLLVQYLHDHYQDDYYWSWAYNHRGYDKYDEGVALLSKHPFQPFTYHLSKETNPDDYRTRIAIGASMTIQQQTYCFMSLHTSWWLSPEGTVSFPYEYDRLNLLQKKIDDPIILMGDFNNPSQKRDEGYDLLMTTWHDSYQLTTAHDGCYTMGGHIAGWENQKEALRIDFILMSQSLNVEKTQVFFDGRKEAPVSDHFAYSVIIND